ncbi:hypothetical protein F5Y03DRAFT_403824 [Xylaria venustula]|nr:hypothetical protein F5Y03DRAFT_403824 [Xylaria venustula]
MESRKNTEVLVSIDFGSTFTKVHYAVHTAQAVSFDELNLEPCKFAKRSTAPRHKWVPSSIQYSPSGDAVGWGYDPIGDGAVVIKGIKLCLQQDDQLVDPMDCPVTADAIQQRRNLRKTAIGVLKDYLAGLWEACRSQIEPPGTPVAWRLVVTHPVGWNIDKLEKAIDAAIITPDRDNSTWTLNFQTEAEAAMLAMLNAYDGQRVPIQNETVMVVDLGGLTMDISTGHFSTQTGIPSLNWLLPPTSQLCGASLFTDTFCKLLENTTTNLLLELPAPSWYYDAIKKWEDKILPTFRPGLCSVLRFHVPGGNFKSTAKETHYRWVKENQVPVHSEEVESIIDFHLEKVTATIEEQINTLLKNGSTVDRLCLTGGFSQNIFVYLRVKELAQKRSIKFDSLGSKIPGSSMLAVSRGAALYGYHLSRFPVSDVHSSDIFLLVGDRHDSRITLTRKDEFMPQHTLKCIPIRSHLIQGCFVQEYGGYKLGVYSTSSDGIAVVVGHITWKRVQRKLAPDDVCTLKMWLRRDGGGGVDFDFLVRMADIAMYVNRVEKGQAYFCRR